MFDRMMLEDAEREHLEFMCALARDADGELILAGLTPDESLWYIESGREWLRNAMFPTGKHRSREDRQRYLELNEKHERARLEQVMIRAGSARTMPEMIRQALNPKVPNDSTPWTAEDVKTIQRMRRQSVSVIARALGRTEGAVRTRASQAGIKLG